MKLDELKDKKVLILGLGKEGLSTLTFLKRLFSDKEIGIADNKTLKELGGGTQRIITKNTKLKLHLGRNYQKSLNLYDVVFRSPGIRFPKSTTAKITSQTKIFLEAHRDKIIGITGTKGKTTTTSLIYKIFKDANLNVELVGNIGNPPFDYIDKIKNTDFFIFELSSFQLQDLQKSPHIAVFLNLYKEHLDYHRGFENYRKAKANIVKWQGKKDFVVYNCDSKPVDEIVRKAKSSKVPFSINI
ncbi:MAG: Mur ligase family protein, partial [Patescibacteria group bacterium]